MAYFERTLLANSTRTSRMNTSQGCVKFTLAPSCRVSVLLHFLQDNPQALGSCTAASWYQGCKEHAPGSNLVEKFAVSCFYGYGPPKWPLKSLSRVYSRHIRIPGLRAHSRGSWFQPLHVHAADGSPAGLVRLRGQGHRVTK